MSGSSKLPAFCVSERLIKIRKTKNDGGKNGQSKETENAKR
jgi:hypothetical protein